MVCSLGERFLDFKIQDRSRSEQTTKTDSLLPVLDGDSNPPPPSGHRYGRTFSPGGFRRRSNSRGSHLRARASTSAKSSSRGGPSVASPFSRPARRDGAVDPTRCVNARPDRRTRRTRHTAAPDRPPAPDATPPGTPYSPRTAAAGTARPSPAATPRRSSRHSSAARGPSRSATAGRTGCRPSPRRPVPRPTVTARGGPSAAPTSRNSPDPVGQRPPDAAVRDDPAEVRPHHEPVPPARRSWIGRRRASPGGATGSAAGAVDRAGAVESRRGS